MELSKCKLQQILKVNKYEEKIKKLEKALFEATCKIKMGADPGVNGAKLKEPTRVDLVHVIDLAKEGGCRVLAYSPILHELVCYITSKLGLKIE